MADDEVEWIEPEVKENHFAGKVEVPVNPLADIVPSKLVENEFALKPTAEGFKSIPLPEARQFPRPEETFVQNILTGDSDATMKTYVEISEGGVASRSWYLRDHGWTGVAVGLSPPVGEWTGSIYSKLDWIQYEHDGTEMGKVASDAIMSQWKHDPDKHSSTVGWLHVTSPHALDTLKALPWQHVGFGVVTVDHNLKDGERVSTCREFLEGKGYMIIAKDVLAPVFLHDGEGLRGGRKGVMKFLPVADWYVGPKQLGAFQMETAIKFKSDQKIMQVAADGTSQEEFLADFNRMLKLSAEKKEEPKKEDAPAKKIFKPKSVPKLSRKKTKEKARQERAEKAGKQITHFTL